MKIFRRKNEYTLNRVRDSIVVREGDETITLYVDSDANSLMIRLQNAQRELESVNNDPSEEHKVQAAKSLAVAMFGIEQAEALFAFYHGNAGCVVTICGMYFGDEKHGLGKKITKVQKKAK